MVAKDDSTLRGYYSLLRWRTDRARDEARNVAVIVVDEHGSTSGFRPAPISSISSRLHEQGILDAAVQGLKHQIAESSSPFTLERLEALHDQLNSSLYVTAPKPVALRGDITDSVTALYKALVAPRGGGSSKQTKSVVLDRVVSLLRRRGETVERGSYIGDFIFDAVVRGDDVRGDESKVLEVLSFAAPRKDWAPIERDAGHFLFALHELDMRGAAIVAPPTDASGPLASAHYEKIERWFEQHDVPTVSPADVAADESALDSLLAV